MAQGKQKKIVPWVQCETCELFLTTKDADKHSIDCPKSDAFDYNYIKNEVLYGTLDVKVNEDVKGVADKNSLVFLSQATIQLCKLAIGEWALIASNENVPPIAKIVWPTTEKSLTSILLTKTAIELNGCQVGKTARLSRLPDCLPEAQSLDLLALNAPKSLKITSELSNRILKMYNQHFFTIGNKINVMYFGKVLKFEVNSLQTWDLNKSFQELNLENGSKFFKVTDKTNIKIFTTQTELKQAIKNVAPLSQIGGLSEEITEIKSAIDACFGRNNRTYGLKHSKSILVYGNPGTGKTLLVSAIARSSKCYFNICGPDLYSKHSGNTEDIIKNIFEEAILRAPSIIILDEVDILCPLRSQRMTESERRVVSLLLSMFDNLPEKVFILGTSNKLEGIDPVFRRFGRFDREMEISTPSPKTRQLILEKLLEGVDHDVSDDNFKEIAISTHGFVGADLAALCSRAGLNAANHSAAQISIHDFKTALKYIRPSAMREVQVEVANVRWEDIGGQDKLKLCLRQAVEWPLRHPESFQRLGITPPRGVLMFGPPGCSKTMIAKALATESGLNFLSIKGPELFSKWVGDSEKAVRDVFRKARQVAPAIIFFDEIDALGGERSAGSSTSVQERVLAQLLTELDGVSPLGDVTVLAATNRPDRIDKALLRPGRLDRIVYVPLPDRDTRREIFKLKLRKIPVRDVDVEVLVEASNNYSGAEVNAVCHEAAMSALEEDLAANVVEMRHFNQAFNLIKPRTPTDLIKFYDTYLNSNS